MSEDYKPPLNAKTWSLLDERVCRAFDDENGFWHIPETRERVIRMRCEDAGHE